MATMPTVTVEEREGRRVMCVDVGDMSFTEAEAFIAKFTEDVAAHNKRANLNKPQVVISGREVRVQHAGQLWYFDLDRLPPEDAKRFTEKVDVTPAFIQKVRRDLARSSNS